MGASLLALAKSIYCFLCRMSRLQLSIGECLRDHKQTILVFLRSWPRYFSCMYFHVFSDILQKNSCGFFVCLFCLFVVFFSMKLHFLVF